MSKPKIGILKFLNDGREFSVFVESWRTYRFLVGGHVYTVADGETLTPYDEWEPPVEDGVWWCESSYDCNGVLIAKDGIFYNGAGRSVGHWTPIRRLCDIPEEWEAKE